MNTIQSSNSTSLLRNASRSEKYFMVALSLIATLTWALALPRVILTCKALDFCWFYWTDAWDLLQLNGMSRLQFTHQGLRVLNGLSSHTSRSEEPVPVLNDHCSLRSNFQHTWIKDLCGFDILRILFKFKNMNFISKGLSEYIFESYSKISTNLKYILLL